MDMDNIKATLSKKVGPFTIGGWLIVLVGGIGLGLVIRRNIGGKASPDYSGTSQPSVTPGLAYGPTQGVTDGGGYSYAPDYTSIPGSPANEGQNRLSDEILARIDAMAQGYFVPPSPDPSHVAIQPGEPGSALTVYTPPDVPITPSTEPSATGISYTVSSGDTIDNVASSIARQARKLGSPVNKDTVVTILRGNYPTVDWDNLKSGTVLVFNMP